MKDADLTFEIEEAHHDYCQSCQALGEKQASRFKTHRSMPTDTRWVKATYPGQEEPRFLVMCADCIAEAMETGVTVLKDGEPWNRKGAMFLRA